MMGYSTLEIVINVPLMSDVYEAHRMYRETLLLSASTKVGLTILGVMLAYLRVPQTLRHIAQNSEYHLASTTTSKT